MRSIDLPELADLQDLEPRELGRILTDLDMLRRRVDAMIAETVGVADRTVAYAEDGHASVSGWIKATCNYSTGETKTVVQSARLIHSVDEARGAAHAGTIGGPQLRLLARVFANPRCADQFPDSAGLLVGHAQTLWFNEFDVVIQRWQTLADTDGAHAAHQRADTHRDAHVSIVGEHVHIDAHGGLAAGSVIEEIFARFCDTEFRADWDTGVAQWGDRMHPGLLDRTTAQRRFDALLAIFNAAAGSGAVGVADPLVNIIVDQATLEHHLATLAGAHPEPLDPSTVDQRRCETSTGHQIDPVDMLAAVLTGHVRRVVLCSTPPGWSSTWVDGPGCSPEGPATRCC